MQKKIEQTIIKKCVSACIYTSRKKEEEEEVKEEAEEKKRQK